MSSRRKPLAPQPTRRLQLMRLESRRVLNGDVQIVALDAPVEGRTVDNSHSDAAPVQDGVGESTQPDLGDANLAHDLGFDVIPPLDQPTADDVANALPDASSSAEPHHDFVVDHLHMNDLNANQFDTHSGSAVAPSTNTTDIHAPTHEIPTSEIVTSFDTLAAPHDPAHSPIDSDAGSVGANHPLLDSILSHDADSPDTSHDHSPDTVTAPVAVDSATSLELSHDSQVTTVARGETATWNEVEPVVVTNTTTINGTLIAPHGVEVDDGGVLKGSGTIDGEVTLLSGGTLSPGNSPGIMNVNGLTLMAGGTLDLDVVPSYQTAGVHYDQFNVTGSVSLGGATLHLVGGSATPSHGQILTIIQNDGSDAVTGTFAGLADGAFVSVGSFEAYISYHGGDGNDVTLTTAYSSTLTISGTSAADVLQVRRIGDTIQTLNGSTVTSATPLAALTGLTIVGNGGGDQLTVNYVDDATSDGFFNLPITFQGGNPTDPPGDRLVISGAGAGPYNTITHNFTNLHDGSVDIAPTGAGPHTVITYTGLEPITDNLSATNRVFNFNGGTETITLTTAAGANMTISSTLGESVTFTNPTTSLTINAGTGNDNVVLTSVNPAYVGTITVDGGSGNDTITGPSEAVTWDVDVGTLNGASFNATFTSMETLQGGGGVDSFQVSASVANVVLRGGLGADDFLIDAPLTGASLVDGQQGSDTLRGIEIDVAVITIVSSGDVTGLDGTETSVGTGGWLNIETLIGNGSPGSSLTGRSISSVWTLNAPPTFSTYLAAAFTLNFSGFTSLQGGTRTDTFNITGDYGPVTLNGGLGTDTINVNTDITLLGTSGLSFTAEAINVGSHVISSVDGNQTYNGLLSLSGSTLSTSGSGEIVLGDNVSVGGTPTSSITGRLNLGGANRTFTVSNAPAGLEIGAVISNGTLTKSGSGTLVLSSGTGANTYAGTTITNGIVRLADDDLLPGNVMIDSNGTLSLNGHSDTIDGLTGTGALNNAAGLATFTVGDHDATSAFGGVISGAISLTKIGTGTLTLQGTNTYSGDTTISLGTLKLSGGNILPDGVGKGNVFIDAGAVLDLGGSGEDINGLSGTGTVDNLSGSGTYTLIVGDNNQTSMFDGVIQDTTGHIALQKIGTGTLTLAGANQYSGPTTVSAGTLSVTGSTATGSPVTVSSSATLTGTGMIGDTVSLSNGGKLSPGLAVGTLATGSLTLISGSQFVVNVNGDAIAGTDYDQLQVTGTVNLGNATLSATGVIPAIGNAEIVLIANDGTDAVVGTFAGLASGATVTIDGVTFQLSYTGGTGNDVVLRAGDTLVSLVAGNLTITDINSTTNDNLVIKSNSALSRFEISDTAGSVLVSSIAGATFFNASTVFVPFSSVVGTQINVLTGEGSDSLTVDLSLGNFGKGITYTAGNPAASLGDSLTLVGAGTFTNITHTFTSNSSGTVNITGNSLITYSEIEEPITDSLAAANRSFTFAGAGETITLADFAGVGLNSIDSTLGANVRFGNPTTALAINLTSGADTLLVEGLDPAFSANLTIDGDGGDNLTFQTNATNLGTGNLLVTDVVNVTFNQTFTTTGNAVLSLTGGVSQGVGDIITASGLGLIVTGTGATTLTEANDVNVLAANTGGTIQFNDFDGLSVGSVTALGTTVTGITTSSDDVKLTTGSSLTIDDDVSLSAGNLFLAVTGTVSQGAGDTITAAGLGLMVSGTTTLTEAGNNVATLAASNGGTINYTDATALTVGSVSVFAMTVTGLTTTGNVKLTTVAGNLTIDEDISLGVSNLFLAVTGNVSQNAGDTITAAGFGLMVSGSTTLTEANDVDTLAANNGGTINFNDSDDLSVGSVTAFMTVTGITTSGDDVKLATGGSLTIDDDIALGAGNLLLNVAANVTQVAGDTIVANGLALMVTGTTTLTDIGNNVAILAASTGDSINYVDANGLTVGSLTVWGMTVTGITTTNDDVKLTTTVANSNLTIDDDIALGTGNLLLSVTGNVSQVAGDTIVANGLALTVTGTTTLTDVGNNVVTLAASTGDTINYVDATGLTVGSLTVMGMAVSGITTSGDNVKLTATAAASDLTIDDDIALGAGNLLLNVTGNVTQVAGDTIIANGLALMVIGTTTLTDIGNNVVTLAANTGDMINYLDGNGLTVGSLTVLGMTVTGITTTNDDVKLTTAAASSNLTIDDDIALGMGNLLLNVTGNVTQVAGDTIVANGLALMVTGTTTLTDGGNNVVTLAAGTDGAINYSDANGLTVGSLTVLGMTVTGITTTNDDVKLTTTAASSNLSIDDDVALGTGHLLLNVNGNVSQVAGDTIIANGLALMVTGSTTLTDVGNNVATFAASNGGTINYTDADGLTVSALSVLGMTTTGITTSNDDVKLTTTAASSHLSIDDDVALGTGNLLLNVNGNVTQVAGDTVIANGLALMVTGTTTLTDAGNNVATLAASNDSTVNYTDANGLTVGSLSVLGMTVTGITTTNDDVKLTTTAANSNLSIDDDIALGTGNLLLNVNGNVSQFAGDTIIANGLALMVTGSTTLTDVGNNVATLAASNGGTTNYTDADGLTVGSVTALGMTTTGITTTNDDVKLTTTAASSNLSIDDDIVLGTGSLILNVNGNVTQIAGDTIVANGLALMVTGTTTLTDTGNNVATLAASTGDTINFVDANGLTVGSLTVLGMTTTGITTTNDDVKLATTAASSNLTIDDDIVLGTGNLLLSVTGNVSQIVGDTVVANGLALMVTGTTTLTDAGNNVATLAASNGDTINYADADGLTAGSLTVLGMTVTGVTTTNDEVKLTTGGNLSIDDDIALGTGNLLLNVTGNVTQVAGDTIIANGLALMVTGTTTLTDSGNNVSILAANSGDTINYADADGLTVGSLTALGMTVTGITTSNDDVKLTTGGNLVIDDDIALGTGNLFLNVTGNVSQIAGDTIAANGLALMVTGTTTLTDAGNNVATFAAGNGGTVNYTDADGLTVGSLTVLGMTVTGIAATNDDVKLTTTAASSNLTIDDDIALGTGHLLLNVTGNVTQVAGDTIVANGLALMVTGTTTLTDIGNDVATLATSTGGTVNYMDVNGLAVGSLSVLGMTVTGITTTNDDVKLTTGGNLMIDDDIALGMGNLLLNVTGNVSQVAGDTIIATGLALMVTGTTTLTDAGNSVAIFAANTDGTINYTDANGLMVGSLNVLGMTLTGVATSNDDVKLTTTAASSNLSIDDDIALGLGNLLLNVTGNVTQVAGDTIVANGLALMVTGTTTLTDAGNNVATLAANNGGTIDYVDANGLTVGSLTVLGMTVTGITSTNDNVTICVMAGNLSLTQDVNVGVGTLRLQADGATSSITQTSGAITAAALGLRAGSGGISLPSASNDVETIAASTTGSFSFQDADGFAIGTVTASGCFTPDVVGITSTNLELCVAAGNLVIGSSINVGANSVRLQATSGSVTETGTATITAAVLGVRAGGGNVTFNNDNDVDTLAAFASGNVSFKNQNGINVGTVTAGDCFLATNGVSTTAETISVTNNVSGNLTVSQAVSAGGANNVTLDANGVNGDLLVNAAVSSGGGLITLTADDQVRLFAAGDITTSGSGGVSVTANASATDGDSGDELRLDDGAVIDAGSGTITLSTSGVNGGDVTLGRLITTNSTASAVTITSNGSVLDGGDTGGADIEANSGTVNITTGTSIGSVANSLDTRVGTLNATATAGKIFIKEVDALTLANVTTTNDDVTICIMTGNLSLTQNVTVGTGTLRLQADGATSGISQSGGRIIAAALGLRAGSGGISLPSMSNDVDTVAATTTGSFSFQDADGFATGTVTAFGDCFTPDVVGITSNSLELCVVTGNLVIGSNISVSNVRLQATAGSVTETGSAAITAAVLGVRAGSGNITLNNDNDVDTLAAFASGSVSIVNRNGVDLSTVAAGDCFLVTNGVSTTSGTISVTNNVSGNLTVSQAVSAGGVNTVTLDANSATADLIVNAAVSSAGGTITLTADDDVTFGAAGDVSSNNGNITITGDANASVAGSVTMNAGTLVNAGSGTIIVTGRGTITLGGLTTSNATTLAVTVTSSAGAIVEAGDTFTEIVANSVGARVTLSAATNIGAAAPATIDTTVANLNATTTNGGIFITETNGLTLNTVSAGGAGSDIDVTSTTSNITVNDVSAVDDVTLAATAGSILDDGSDATVISGDALTFSARNTIGAPLGGTAVEDLDTTAVSITATTTGSGANNGIWITETNAVTITNATTADGVIELQSGGAMTATSVTAGGTGRNIRLQTMTGNIGLGAITATGDGVRARSAGAITDVNGGTNNFTADRLQLVAVSGIGSSDAIETTVTTLASSNTTSGNIAVTNNGALIVGSVGPLFGQTLNGVTNGGTDNITIAATKSLTINSAVGGGGDITLAAGDSASDDDDLTINVNVGSTGTGFVELRAGDDIVQTAGAITIGAGGLVGFTADHEGAGGGDTDRGGVSQLGGSLTATKVVFRSGEAVDFGTAGTSNVDHLAASITQSGSTFKYRDVDDIDIAFVGGIHGITTNDGNVLIQAPNHTINVTDSVITAGAGSGGTISITAGVIDQADGSVMDAGAATITLLADGNITLGNVTTTNAGLAAITITSTTGGIVDGGNTGGADIEANSGTVTITTRGAIGSAGAGAIDTQVGTLKATSTTGGIFINEADAITLSNVTTANGAINITAGGTITATNVVSKTDSDANDIRLTTITTGDILVGIVQISTTGTATAGDIFLTSAGAIEESGADAARDLIAQELHLVAGTGIGALGAIEFLASLVSADVIGAGDINLAADTTTDMTVTSLTSVGGNIDFELAGNANLFFTGPISSGSATVNGGNITLNHPDGKVTVADDLATDISSGAGGVPVVFHQPIALDLSFTSATGAVLIVSGATVNRDIVLGAGNITINGKDQPAVSPGSPTMPRVEVPPPPIELPKFFVPDAIVITPARNTTETISSGAVSSSILTDEFYELRRSNEDGTIETERLNEFSGEALLDQAKLEEFMQDRGDGDYEIWFATKDARDGAQIERRVMQFRLQDFHIVPTTSDTPNLIPEQKLAPQPPANKPIPEQPEQPQGANGNDSLDAAADTMSSLESDLTDGMLPVSEFVSHDVLHRIDGVNSDDMEQSESEVVTGEQTAGAVMLLTAATWRRRRRTSSSDNSTFSKSARLARRWQR